MRIGVVFPQVEIGADPGAIREYAQAAESMGYDHLLAFDHVVGANPASRPNWRGYKHTDMFYEPLVLFGYLASITQRLELVTGILILPQRQTVLVAKQASIVDVLSGGRLRLGIGIGWNEVEYEALGENFHNRGRRSEEQIEVMRLLWTRELVTFKGRWHQITDAGINPLPVQRPIPIWFGGTDDRVLKRVARMGDGWFPLMGPDTDRHTMIGRLHQYMCQEGRDPKEVGIEGLVSIVDGTPEDWRKQVLAWKEIGATHISVNTMRVPDRRSSSSPGRAMRAGLSSPDAHIDAIKRFKEVAQDVVA